MRKYLIVSDIHLGDPRFVNESKLLSLLSSEDFDVLVLNGDIWDCWIEKDIGKLQEKYWQLIIFLRTLCVQKEVIWILGNHDPELDKAYDLLPDALICDSYVMAEGNDFTCLIEHGQHLDYMWNLLFSRVSLYLTLCIHKLTGGRLDLQRWYEAKNPFYRMIYRKLEKYFMARHHEFNNIVIGHTHVPSQYIFNGSQLVNSGDWIYHEHYITLSSSGVFQLHQYSERVLRGL
jgi:UDP-2,3-diacylglucosamine pyrophosphatase LpxH